jgi:hypothetical protein
MFGLFGHSLEHLGVWDLGERCPPRSQPPGCVVMGPEHVLGTACKVSIWILHICNLFMIIARYYMSPGTGRIRVVSKERAPLRGTLVRVGSVNKASIPRPSPRLRGSAAAAAKVRQRVSKNPLRNQRLKMWIAISSPTGFVQLWGPVNLIVSTCLSHGLLQCYCGCC